jgi:hypothetical protein
LRQVIVHLHARPGGLADSPLSPQMVSALDGITPSAFEFVRRRITSARVGICLRRDRADRAFPPSKPPQMFGDAGAVLSRHWLIFDNCLAQHPIRSDEFVPVVALGVVEQAAQCPHREGLRLVDPGTYDGTVDEWLTAVRRSAAGIARLITPPAAAVDFPLGRAGRLVGNGGNIHRHS